jgi:hypothetical protein
MGEKGTTTRIGQKREAITLKDRGERQRLFLIAKRR